MAGSKFVEMLDTDIQPTYSAYNVSLDDILAETQRRCSSSGSSSSSSGYSADGKDGTRPTSPSSPVKSKFKRFSLSAKSHS